MLFATPPGRYILGVLPWYSVLIVGAIVLSIFITSKEERRLSLPVDTVIDSAFYLIPFGIVGARLYYVVFEWDQFRNNLVSILFIWQGGLAIYGALIGGILGLWFFSKRRKLPIFLLLDMFAPCVALSQSIGRWGNYFNQEAFGYAVTDPAHQFFPLAVLITTGSIPQWFYATFFYESVWDIIVFIILLFIKQRKHKQGDVFLWYLMFYSLGRAIIEGMRSDSLTVIGGTIRVSQLISIAALLIISIYFILKHLRRKPHDA